MDSHPELSPLLSVCANLSWVFEGRDDGIIKAQTPSGNLQYLEGHTDTVKTLCLSDDGQFLFSGSYDGTVKIWHNVDGIWQLFRTLECNDGRAFPIVCVSGERLFTADWTSGSIGVWNWQDGTLVEWIGLHQDARITCLCVSGEHLFSGGLDNNVKVWNWKTRTLMWTLEGHTKSVQSLCVSGKVLFSGSLDKTIKVWNWKAGVCIGTLEGHHSDYVRSLCVLGTILFSVACGEQWVQTWDLQLGQPLNRVIISNGNQDFDVTGVCAVPNPHNPNNGWVFAVCDNGILKMVNIYGGGNDSTKVPNKKTPYVSLRF